MSLALFHYEINFGPCWRVLGQKGPTRIAYIWNVIEELKYIFNEISFIVKIVLLIFGQYKK